MRVFSPKFAAGWLCLCVLPLLLLPLSGKASPGCFSLADNYYEQVFCELEAAGKGRELPAWFEFRRNPEQTQALLLKPIARKAGIPMKMPRAEAGNGIGGDDTDEPVIAIAPSASALGAARAPMDQGGDCRFREGYLRCGEQRYHFAGNRANGELVDGVLESGYSMGIPGYTGDPGDTAATRDYLQAAYSVYLSKMMAIGLAEATLPFFKFERIFHDHTAKGVDFPERFERMFFYLKKDKKNMAVAVSGSPPEGFTASHCVPVSGTLVSCVYAQRNYLFSMP